jgi:serine/threonine protein kinase
MTLGSVRATTNNPAMPKLLRLLGEGGMGSVYEAEHKGTEHSGGRPDHPS